MIPFMVSVRFLLLCYLSWRRRVCAFILLSLVALGQNNWTLGSGLDMCIEGSLEVIYSSLSLDVISTTQSQLLSCCSNHCNRLVTCHPGTTFPHYPDPFHQSVFYKATRVISNLQSGPVSHLY